jgi:general secretion pathway protein F/type IV pilus assembly protein PilC
MPLFRYQAVVSSGRKTIGVIEADSLSTAKDRLRQQNMVITDVAPYLEIKKKPTLPFTTLLDITRMISQLLHAGIPLYEALVIVEEKYQKTAFHPILIDLCDRVKKGESLSISLSHYNEIFDPIYISMVRAGEESGALTSTFEQLTELLKDKSRLKKQLIAATAYPLFLGSFCIIVFVSLLIWVIPSLKNLFEGRALHPLTQFVFKLSDLFLDHSFFIFGGFALLAAGIFTCIKHPRFRASWDHFLLKLPLIGPLILLAATTRFCRTCSLLLEGGTPLLYALQLTRAVLKNRILETALIQVEKNISEGGSLSQQIENTRLMPSLVSRMLAIGEKTGQNAAMLKHIAILCEEHLTRTLQRYTSLLQPLLLLFLGLLIGTVILSILIPLTDVGSVLQG